ncbi:MAG TPA: DUF1697 domain-containing protein [Candidatus Methylacidiphilales bacterium]
MIPHVALLRGINVGGKTTLPMADLRALLEAEGLGDVKTLLQSGNALFRAKADAALESRLEKAAAKRFGRPIDFFVRKQAEWEKLVAGNPFAKEAAADPGHLVVLALKADPSKETLAALKAAIKGPEYFAPGDRSLYLVYPDGIGRSKLTPALLEKHLGPGTARNWNTVQKIAASFDGST